MSGFIADALRRKGDRRLLSRQAKKDERFSVPDKIVIRK